MSQENLPKGYDPAAIEQQWRDHWEQNKTFTPEMPAKSASYSIVIPPPNVTGNLHIGHALNLTLQDILCRHARQQGKTVLWVPGYDHAGIATQNVVERRLAADEGKSRDDLGREAFLERVWRWKEEYGGNITRQVKAMGCSVDWTRERFTMDEGLSRAVRKVFAGLYKQGLVYKGDYIVNWCTRCHTALADDEVDHVPQKTKLWSFNYPLEDGSGHITIATVRPETILGDVAIAVHPEDERYQHLVGKKAILPILRRPIPIIADNYVDREFGTGAVKITPAHDLNDWLIGEKHKLEVVQVIDDAGIMNAKAGPFAGLPKLEAREKVAAEFEKLGLLAKVEDYENSIGLCYRCKEIIEPHISTQWFVSMRPLADKAIAAVPSRTQLFPDTWLKTYYHWLDTVRDWCVSRQIWWGHRIPAWTCGNCGALLVEEEAPQQCDQCGCAELQQDQDVLDTWFSSALWPFSTLGWPEETQDLKTFYPTSVLVTGFDILFFWVARMMMLGLQFMDEVPFRHVYIHALVRDADGRKMSKSIGNVIDPLEMIGKYGTDALRFTLTAFAAMGRDIRLSEERIDGYRHFVNKIWNASRFALMNMPADGQLAPLDPGRVEGIHHQWILHRLEEVKADTLKSIGSYRFNDYAQGLYKFIWTELCDWYLELIKTDMQAGGEKQTAAQYVLWTVLRETLVLLHPVMPFVTAEVWAALPTPDGKPATDIALEPFPAARPACLKAEAAAQMSMVQEAIVAVRTIRAELNIAPALRLKAIIKPQDDAAACVLESQRPVIEALARLGELVIDVRAAAPRLAANQVASGNEIIVPLEGAVDFEAEKARLDKELVKLEKELAMLEGKLANPNYLEKAPPHLVERDRARVDELKDAALKLKQVRARFA
ncbi:MAG: valine--tRNA ligase [Deltaproteobacteria bacterium]|jgi:valyl-tRNA synthetase|nr:valine--tRNA ligase [Deltaproteobacteria bacterium]